jgi:RNA polymerase sigma-70 factor (ECF subfamily)
LTDAEIIRAVLAGDSNAFRELVIRYEPRVAATVIGMLGKGPESEDVGQETFIRFFKSLRDFRGESSVSTYLTRIAINLSLNELKKRKRRSLFFRAESGESFDIPDENASKGFSEEKELLQRALQKLNIQFRSVIILRLVDGYSTEETAKILNIPIGTVLSRLARAQQKLKEILSPIYEE